MRNRWRLIITALVTILAALVVWPWPNGISLGINNLHFERKGFTLGLDLQGGTHLVLQADMTKAPGQDANEVL
jgi:preprotein translocase subunit SecD